MLCAYPTIKKDVVVRISRFFFLYLHVRLILSEIGTPLVIFYNIVRMLTEET